MPRAIQLEKEYTVSFETKCLIQLCEKSDPILQAKINAP